MEAWLPALAGRLWLPPLRSWESAFERCQPHTQTTRSAARFGPALGTTVAAPYSMPRILLVCCAFLLLSFNHELGSKPLDVQLEMRNVPLHLDDGIVLSISRLRGITVSRSAGAPVFDDPRSYVLRLQTASMSMDMASACRT
jgi:hypothetical protein